MAFEYVAKRCSVCGLERHPKPQEHTHHPLSHFCNLKNLGNCSMTADRGSAKPGASGEETQSFCGATDSSGTAQTGRALDRDQLAHDPI